MLKYKWMFPDKIWWQYIYQLRYCRYTNIWDIYGGFFFFFLIYFKSLQVYIVTLFKREYTKKKYYTYYLDYT